MLDEPVAAVGPAPRLPQCRDVLLHAQRVLRRRPPQAAREPAHVGVHGDGGLTEGVAEHDVGGLAPHARQGHELLAAARHPPLEALGERLTDAEQMAGLSALEAERPQDRLEVLAPGRPQGRGVGVALEELGGDGVDARVSGLRRQDGGDEQLEGAVMIQGAGGVRVEGHELVVDGARTPGRLGRHRHLGPSGLATHCPTHCSPSSLRNLTAGTVSHDAPDFAHFPLTCNTRRLQCSTACHRSQAVAG